MNLLIRNALIVTMNEQNDVIEKGALDVEKGMNLLRVALRSEGHRPPEPRGETRDGPAEV